MNLNEKPSPSSELPTEFGQSVSDQLKSLVEDTRNASILSLVAMHKKKQKMNWYFFLRNYILSLDVTDFIFLCFYDLCYTITAI